MFSTIARKMQSDKELIAELLGMADTMRSELHARALADLDPDLETGGADDDNVEVAGGMEEGERDGEGGDANSSINNDEPKRSTDVMLAGPRYRYRRETGRSVCRLVFDCIALVTLTDRLLRCAGGVHSPQATQCASSHSPSLQPVALHAFEL